MQLRETLEGRMLTTWKIGFSEVFNKGRESDPKEIDCTLRNMEMKGFTEKLKGYKSCGYYR